jgi:ParB-like chromosome segregation protein Spo0J
MNADSERKKPKHAGPQMAVRWLPVEALEPDPRNARLHPPGQVSRIADSIAAFGFNVPVLIDGESRIVAGHGRALAARRLGLAEIPTIALDHLSEAERRAFMIADNRLAELASWDENRLGVELEALKCLDLDFALSATGFEIGEIDLKIEPPHGPGRGRGPRRRRGPPVARAGETWALGPHRLVCGDAHDEAAYRALDAAIRRWQAETGETARLQPTGERFDKVARARRRAGAAEEVAGTTA